VIIFANVTLPTTVLSSALIVYSWWCAVLMQRCSLTWRDFRLCSCSYCCCPLNIRRCWDDSWVCYSASPTNRRTAWQPTTSPSCLFHTSLCQGRFAITNCC